MFTKQASTRVILLNLAKALLAIAVAATLMYVASGRIAKIAGSLAEKKKAALYLQKRSQALASLRVELARVGTNADKLGGVFPPDDNISEFLAVLRDIGRQSGLTVNVQTGTPAPALAEGGLSVSAVPISISANGTVATLKNFLKAVESLPYLINIQGISISAASGWEGGANISMQAQLYAKQTQ